MNIPHPQQGNGLMDMIKSQMITMTMMSSMNGNNTNSNQGVFSLLYVFIITQVIDALTRHMPGVAKKLYDHYVEKISKADLLKEFAIEPAKNTTKTASITVLVKIADHENIIGQSILDYVTNNVNTKHISYKKQNFVLNQNDIIEIYDEIFIALKENKTVEASDKSSPDIEQCVELFSYTKSMQELRAFLNKITHEYKIKIQNKLGDKIYFFNQHPTNAPKSPNGEKDYSKLPNNSIFTMKEFQTNRKFTNLFGPEISVVRKRVEFFMKNRKWYDSKGIPYTLGLLLSGQAGAGKTSTIKCLANETRRHIINLNLNNDITKTQLENLFFNEMIIVLNVSTGQSEKYFIPLDQRVYVLEDIDCQSDLVMERSLKNKVAENIHKEESPKADFQVNIETNPGRKTNEKEQLLLHNAEKIDLSFLLNLLDGVLENPGRIVIMTSNFPKLLDHALIRPGRIDVIADFKKCFSSTLIEMIEFFYDISLTDDEKLDIANLKEHIISPAEMGKLMFENFYDYGGVIMKLQELSVKEINACVEAPQNVINEISKQICEEITMVDSGEKALEEKIASRPNYRDFNMMTRHNATVEAQQNVINEISKQICEEITMADSPDGEKSLEEIIASRLNCYDFNSITRHNARKITERSEKKMTEGSQQKMDTTELDTGSREPQKFTTKNHPRDVSGFIPPELDTDSSKPEEFNTNNPWKSSSFAEYQLVQ